jgi:hypothetical protein
MEPEQRIDAELRSIVPRRNEDFVGDGYTERARRSELFRKLSRRLI